uniref:Uncharacterized protein n=1 Tax=Utricularia reniformis TaxID=192314 RepID=A0A1Y0B232_9LAMI|nr:hypothetical protein AEK19_MT1314 [Utricularia reniformis]ART31515.1 hypothetical protein AEK19_MT1314 [Utricularia reniformis]
MNKPADFSSTVQPEQSTDIPNSVIPETQIHIAETSNSLQQPVPQPPPVSDHSNRDNPMGSQNNSSFGISQINSLQNKLQAMGLALGLILNTLMDLWNLISPGSRPHGREEFLCLGLI